MPKYACARAPDANRASTIQGDDMSGGGGDFATYGKAGRLASIRRRVYGAVARLIPAGK